MDISECPISSWTVFRGAPASINQRLQAEYPNCYIRYCYIIVEKTLQDIVRAVLWAGKEICGAAIKSDCKISVKFDDSYVINKESTNEAAATVDANGKVTAVGEGLTNIYAQNADGTFKEYIPVKVVPGTADAMRLAVHLKVGEKAKFHLSDDASQVTWKSMDETVAAVSATGQVTAAKKGLAIIQGELGGQAYQIYVRVNG